MSGLDNLPLVRVDIEYERLKRPGFGNATTRDYGVHGNKIDQEVRTIIDTLKRPRPVAIKPELILKIQYSNNIQPDELRRSGLEIIGESPNKALIVFSTDLEMEEFRRRITSYSQGPQDSKNPSYNNLIANIEQVSLITSTDRVGPKLGRLTIEDETTYWVDVELWHLGDSTTCREKVREVSQLIANNSGRVTDDYIGSGIVLLRANVTGKLLGELLEIDTVRQIDLPPKPTFNVREIPTLEVGDFNVQSPPDNSAGVCIIDSGVATGHPFLGPAVGYAASFPEKIGGSEDVQGHGTKVAGIALYGDVLNSIQNREFVPLSYLYSARVTNQYNQFDDETLITSQMREAITYFHREYGCRIFNISLGDPEKPYVEGKQGIWAAVLDEIARELDVVVIVSAGNYFYHNEDDIENILRDYPNYLFTEAARIIEPATAALALTVGSHCEDGGPMRNLFGLETTAALRVIGRDGHPSPFTRSGPGVQGAIKPELCEPGGNQAYNALMRRIVDDRGLSVVTTSRELPSELFTFDIGTSFAAPRVAYKASQILNKINDASANLIRALLVHSATSPYIEQGGLLSEDQVVNVLGYGVSNPTKILESSQTCVNLFAENTMELDKFHVYELPIPDDFNLINGNRVITVTLAFDPPTRHTRNDYLGVKMSFRLIRGKSIEEVIHAYRAVEGGNPRPDNLGNTKFECVMEPKPTIREKGTVQKGAFSASRKLEYGNTYYLVVRAENQWADEHLRQRYAVVVSIEHSNQEVRMYTDISNRIEETIRVEARAVKKVRIRV